MRPRLEFYGKALVGSRPQLFANDIKSDLKKWIEMLSKAGLAKN